MPVNTPAHDEGMRDTVRAVFDGVEAHDEGGSGDERAARSAYAAHIEDGWALVGLSEELGGAGGDLTDAVLLADSCARAGQPSPLADQVIVTNRLLAHADIARPTTADCIVVPPSGEWPDRASWARWASHVVVLSDHGAGTKVSLVPAAVVTIEPADDPASQPYDRLSVTEVDDAAVARVILDQPGELIRRQVRRAGALARSVQMTAALERILATTADYCGVRNQFGRPLTAFQAVAHGLAELAGETRAARAVVDDAVRYAQGDRLPLAPVASAKARSGAAAGAGARIAHQLHGAIGTTREYPLHRYTAPLWAWRDQFGTETEWSTALFDELTRNGTTSPWPALAAW